MSAQCNRVPVLEGHLECVSVRFSRNASAEEVTRVFNEFESPIASLNLPTAPNPFVYVFDDQRFPQPRRHSELGHGMTVSVGRIRPCEILDVKFIVLSHNTIRGAAGGAVLNAELLVSQGYLTSKEAVVEARV